MKIKGYLFSQTTAGPVEVAHELGDVSTRSGQHPWLVYCDVLALDEFGQPIADDNSVALASLIEKWIEEALAQESEPTICEASLTTALQHANRRLLRRDCHELHQVAVSAAIMALVPRQDGSEGHEILIAGSGDSRTFHILPERVESVFADPMNRTLATDLNPADRLRSLNNALGIREEIKVHTRRLAAGPFQRFAVVSYGLYQQLQEQELLSLGLKPHDKQLGAPSVLSTKASRGHILSVFTTTFGDLQEAKQQSMESEAPQPHALKKKRAKKRRAVAGLAVATAAIATGLGSLMLVDTPEEEEILAVAEASVQQQIPAAAAAPHSPQKEESEGVDKNLLADLEEQNRVQADTITTLRHHLQEARQRISTLETTSDPGTIARLRDKLEDASDELEDRTSSEEKAVASLRDLQKENAHLKSSIKTLEEVLARADREHEQKVEALNTHIDGLQEWLAKEQAKSKPIAPQETVRELDDKLRSARGQISALEAERSELEQKREQLESTLISTQAQLEKARQRHQDDIAALQHQMTVQEEKWQHTLATEKAELKEQLDQINSRYHTERSATAALESKVRELQDLPHLLAQERERSTSLAERLRESVQETRSKEELFVGNAEELTRLRLENDKLATNVQELRAAVDTYMAYEDRYNEERQLRIDKEQRLERLLAGINEQKQWLSRIDSSRSQLEEELARIKKDRSTSTAQADSRESYSLPPPNKEIASLDLPAGDAPVRVHLVAKGETLSSISSRYYGTPNRWQDIYNVNKESITDTNRIRPGTALLIP